jgi:hypothetical protein
VPKQKGQWRRVQVQPVPKDVRRITNSLHLRFPFAYVDGPDSPYLHLAICKESVTLLDKGEVGRDRLEPSDAKGVLTANQRQINSTKRSNSFDSQQNVCGVECHYRPWCHRVM